MNIPRLPKKINHKDNAVYKPAKRKLPLNFRFSFWLLVLVLVVVLIFVRNFYLASSKSTRTAPPQEVVLATATTADVPVYLNGLGSVLPVYTVTVMPQINGILMSVFYKEGQFVKAGEVLAQIDPRPFEAQLVQQQGQLQHDEAVLTNDQLNLKRFQLLWTQNSTAKQTLDTQTALVKQDQGTVQVDKGLIAATQLNLYYCRIISPVSGRIGLRLVDPGNYVQTSTTTGIAVVTTLSPITVEFVLPEDNIPEIMKKIYAGQALQTLAYDRSQTNLLATGQLLTVDNQINLTTGTVKLRAQFDNKDYQLFPNQFVNIRLLINTLHNAVIVPTASIQQGSQEPYIYVLNDDKETVKMQAVVMGVTEGTNTTISNGIQSGQSVVTEGADSLKDGSKVTIAGASTAAKKSLAMLINLQKRYLA